MRLFEGIGPVGVQLLIAAIVVGCGVRFTDAASASVPVFTDQRSTPQSGFGVGVGVGEALTPQVVAAAALLWGLGAPAAKSLLLLLLSVQPLFSLNCALVLPIELAGAWPSEQFALP